MLDAAVVITTPNSETIEKWRFDKLALFGNRFVPFYDVNMSKLRE